MGLWDSALEFAKDVGKMAFDEAKSELLKAASKGAQLREFRESGASKEELREAYKKMR